MNIHTAVAAAVLVFMLLIVSFSGMLKKTLRFFAGAALGTAVMAVGNILFPAAAVGINPFTVFASGVLGLPGTAMVYILKNVMC